MSDFKDFFVMLNTQGGGIMPLMDGENIAMFANPYEAKQAADQNILGHHCGFEVFERGCGI